MNKTLQEILEVLQEQFPKVQEKTFIKVLFTLKARNNQYMNIGFSRYECSKFGIGEATLQKIIYFIRNIGLLELKGQVLRKEKDFKCNIYKLSENFLYLFDSLEFFTKRMFEYINPLDFMKKLFSYKYKHGIYEFKVNGEKYIIQTRGAFKGVIYGISENKIINPLSLL